MIVTSGRVIDGKVVVEGDALEEGARVTVLAPGDDEPFELTADEEAAIQAGLEDVRQGRVISAARLLERLARR